MSEIVKKIKLLIHNWQNSIAGKAKPVSPHPSQQILDLLEQAYHSSNFSRDLDVRCRELMDEVSSAPPKWPSITGHDHELAVIQHVEQFVDRLAKPEQTQLREITMDQFLEQYCGIDNLTIRASRRRMLFDAHRKNKIKLPLVREPKKGHKNHYNLNKLLNNWGSYQKYLPNPVPLSEQISAVSTVINGR